MMTVYICIVRTSCWRAVWLLQTSNDNKHTMLDWDTFEWAAAVAWQGITTDGFRSWSVHQHVMNHNFSTGHSVHLFTVEWLPKMMLSDGGWPCWFASSHKIATLSSFYLKLNHCVNVEIQMRSIFEVLISSMVLTTSFNRLLWLCCTFVRQKPHFARLTAS